MSKTIEVGVVGLGKFGLALAEALVELGQTVVGVDTREERIRRAQETLTQVYRADATDRRALEQLGFKDLDYVVVSTGSSMEAGILVVLNLQEIGVKNLWAKAAGEEHAKVLKKLGVHFVVFPEQFVARQMAHKLAMPGIVEYLGLGERVILREVPVDAWAGKTLRDLALPTTYGVQAVAVKPKGSEEFDFVPRADLTLEKDDVLVLIGSSDSLREIGQ